MPWEAGQFTLEEAGCQRVEALLPRRVPNLHLQRLVVEGQLLHLEVDGDCGQVVDREVALLEALQQAGLAHPALAHDQHLHQVVVLARAHSYLIIVLFDRACIRFCLSLRFFKGLPIPI